VHPGGQANHVEILGHYYAFANPRTQKVVNPPPPCTQLADLMSFLTKDERRTLVELLKEAGRRMRPLNPNRRTVSKVPRVRGATSDGPRP
jgi:hypothetical protein